jgi:hypothetical protein
VYGRLLGSSPTPVGTGKPRLCAAQVLAASLSAPRENFESHTFRQGFLNLLETPAAYPDSSGLPWLGAGKEICL